MRKITILTLIFVLGLVSFTNISATIVPEGAVENSLTLCTNGEDDNGNGMTDLQDADCSAFVPAPVFVENTLVLCSDGEDNNGNGMTDLQDESCSAFVPAPVFAENTLVLCTNGEDDNGNGMTDLQDVDCSAFAPVATTTATTTPEVATGGTVGPSFGSGTSFGSSFGSGITSGTPVSAIATGTPISATGTEPVCAEMLKTFMKKGKTNNVSEVKKLQGLLNKYLGLSLPTTGFFGNATHNAVKSFQLKYKDTILTPWAITAPTGYFYKTTQRQMNLLLCSTADIPMPVLN